MISNKTNICFICAVLHLLILQISASVQNDILYIILYLFAYALPSFILWKTVKDTQDTEKKPIALTHIFAFFPIMITISSVAVLIFDSASAGNYEVNTSTFLLAGLAAPICEEIFWRGSVFRSLKKYGFLPSALITSLLFALMHSGRAEFIYALFSGILFSYLYYITDSCASSIILHLLNNCIALLGALFPLLPVIAVLLSAIIAVIFKIFIKRKIMAPNTPVSTDVFKMPYLYVTAIIYWIYRIMEASFE